MKIKVTLIVVALAATTLAGSLLAAPAFGDAGNNATTSSASTASEEATEGRAQDTAAPLNAQARKYAALLEVASAQTGRSLPDLVAQLRNKSLAQVIGRDAAASVVQQVLAQRRAELEAQGVPPARIERLLKQLEQETKRLITQRVPPPALRQLTRWVNGGFTPPTPPATPPAITPGPRPIYGPVTLSDRSDGSVNGNRDNANLELDRTLMLTPGDRPIYGMLSTP